MKPQIILCALALLAGALAHADGEKGGNGGDMCEDRFKTVRDDIASWIRKGGPAGLNLPPGVTLAGYDSAMTTAIGAAKITCIDDVITVGGAEKTCRNGKDGDGVATIACNTKRFLATLDSDQYVLVHHEYAGLAGLEANQGSESQYPISNQISEFLELQSVRKLAIRKPVQTGVDPHEPAGMMKPGNEGSEIILLVSNPEFSALDAMRQQRGTDVFVDLPFATGPYHDQVGTIGISVFERATGSDGNARCNQVGKIMADAKYSDDGKTIVGPATHLRYQMLEPNQAGMSRGNCAMPNGFYMPNPNPSASPYPVVQPITGPSPAPLPSASPR